MSTDLDPFAALGLPAGRNLSDEQVHDAWRAIATATDPDRPDGGDPARYAAATAAYASLRTAQGRSQAYADLAAKRGAAPRRKMTQSEQANVVACCVFSVLALIFVIFPGLELPAAIRAASGKGIRGLWTATHTVKGRWHGTFQLPDGKVLLRDVVYNDPLPAVHVRLEGAGTVFRRTSLHLPTARIARVDGTTDLYDRRFRRSLEPAGSSCRSAAPDSAQATRRGTVATRRQGD